jgi:uncharacterized membrane protein
MRNFKISEIFHYNNIDMKSKIRSIFCLFFAAATFSLKAHAEEIKSFNADILINKDGTINVKETIIYDFQGQQRHGIFRKIDSIKTNQDGRKYILDFNVLHVSDENNHPYKYQESRSKDWLELKIGDPDKTLTGVKTYVLEYKVSGALTYFTDHDELYWNLTGDGWEIPIKDFSGSVSFYQLLPYSNIKYICYEGVKGSTSQDCKIDYLDDKVSISSNKNIVPGEGITLVVSFPKGVVSVLEPREYKTPLITKIFLVLLGLGAIYWYLIFPIKYLISLIKQRKFFKNNQRIVSAWFEPPKYENGITFSPAETGFIVDNKIDHRELTATIINLAQRGFLKIREDGKRHFSFILSQNANFSELRDFEKKVMVALFNKDEDISDLSDILTSFINPDKLPKIIKSFDGNDQLKSDNNEEFVEVSTKDLKKSKTLFGKIVKFNTMVEEEVVNGGMYKTKPTEELNKNYTFTWLGLATLNIPLALIGVFLGKNIVKRTEKGIEKYSEAFSLFNFLKSQDEQLNFQSKNQMFFEKLLPYAAAFGVEKIWAERFKDISIVKPDWYEGDGFTDSGFITSMTHSIGGSMRSAYNSGMSSTRSSSGFSSGFSGGSSGGGGGGGGGGSW